MVNVTGRVSVVMVQKREGLQSNEFFVRLAREVNDVGKLCSKLPSNSTYYVLKPVRIVRKAMVFVAEQFIERCVFIVLFFFVVMVILI